MSHEAVCPQCHQALLPADEESDGPRHCPRCHVSGGAPSTRRLRFGTLKVVIMGVLVTGLVTALATFAIFGCKSPGKL
jgi:uncharacterized paraquat-inducible protein A